MSQPPPYGRTSRVWDSLLAIKSGCAGGRGFTPQPEQYSKDSFSSNQETGKVFSPGEIDWEHPGIHRGNLITCAGSERVTDRVCSIK